MTLSEMIQENREEGFEEGCVHGVQRKALETAKNFLENKIDPNLIAKCTDLSLDQVLTLQKEICVTVC